MSILIKIPSTVNMRRAGTTQIGRVVLAIPKKYKMKMIAALIEVSIPPIFPVYHALTVVRGKKKRKRLINPNKGIKSKESKTSAIAKPKGRT